jgi:hypothetical protein
MEDVMETKKKAIAVVLTTVLLFSGVVGCFSQSTLAALVNVLGSATSTLATIQGDPALAQQIKTDTAAAVAAITNWKKGTPAQMVVEALGIVADDLNLIPYAGPYVPLISLALVTVQEIVTLITANSPTPVAAHKPKVTQRQVVYSGKIPKNDKQFREAWNKIVASDPQLSSAAIH